MPLVGRRRETGPEIARAPQLTVMIRGHEHADRAYRLAQMLRPHADELLIFADTALSDPELALLQAAGPDRLVRLPSAPPTERALAYMYAQANGRWILRFDGDEIPSRALLDALPELLADERHVRYELARAWLWPDADAFLRTRPWWPDLQSRLTRNVPGLLFVPGALHSTIELPGPARLCVDMPIYHWALLAPEEVRAAKAAEYEGIDDKADMLGLPFNVAYYLPERHPERPQPVPVPDADRALIAAVLDGDVPADPPRLRGLPPTVSQADVDALWAQRPLVGPAYEAQIELAEDDLRFEAHRGRQLFVRVENTGAGRWRWAGHSGPEIYVSYRWLSAGGEPVVPEGLRTPLPGPLEPGDTIVVGASVSAPDPGDYVLEIDMVHEHVRWFDAPLRVPVTVTP